MSIPALKKIYQEKVVPELKKNLGIDNPHLVPNLEKIVVSSGIRSEMPKEWVQEVVKEVAKITGGANMWDFLYKFISVVLPSIRDFRGVPTKLDGAGNYNYGIADHTIFPEVTVDPGRKNIGMDITIVTTASDDNSGRELLKLLGMPFRKPTTTANTKK